MREKMWESLREKLVRHGYSYVGNSLIQETLERIEADEALSGHQIMIDDRSLLQSRLTIVGWDR